MVFVFPFLVIGIGAAFFLMMARKYRRIDRVIDIGEVLIAIFLVYGLVPGIGFALAESGFGEVDDNRLYHGYLRAQLEYVQWLYLLLVGSFALVYAAGRRPVIGKVEHGAQTGKLVWPVIVAAIALTFALSLASQIWGADVGNDYISSYTQLRDAPILVQQFAGIGSQLQLSLSIAAISLAIAAWPTRHVYVALVLVANMIFTVVAGGSRSYSFLVFVAYLAATSIYVPAFRVRRVVLLAIPALLLFLVAGLLRGGINDADPLNFFFNSEFTAVFVTPLDLHIRFPQGISGAGMFNTYTVDLLRFIPSQFLPVQKVDPGDWYVRTLYEAYHAAGGGFAFGILAEIVLGQGKPEAVVRGALLGLMFSFAANRLLVSGTSPIKIIVYIWLIVLGYQCYRDTTFSIAARMFLHLSPVLIFLVLLRMGRQPVSRISTRQAA